MPKGIYKKSEEHKNKIRSSLLLAYKDGRKFGFKRGHKINIGRKRPDLSERMMGNNNVAKRPEIRKKISERLMGHFVSDKTRKKQSEWQIGKKLSEETKRKMRESHRGEKSWNWRGGISFEPYSIDWTETLKRSVRERDHYTCQMCGKEPAICVHHKDYNKKNCNPDNLITLCRKCHTKTNHHRNYWTKYFLCRK